MAKFVHLHTHSHYSLLDGLAKIDDLIARAKELGMEALALTDHGNLYGAVEFYKKAKKAGVKPILGVEVYLAPNGRMNKRAKIDDKRFHLTLLAKNAAGWRNLIKLVTKSYLEGFYYKPRVDRELLEQHREGLVCLSGCFSGEVMRALKSGDLAKAEEAARWHRQVFGDDYYLEIQPHTKELHGELTELSKKTGIPLVATQDIHYLRRDDAPVHEVLLAVQTQSRIDDEDRMSMKDYDVSFRPAEEMAEEFKELPEATANSIRIAESCTVELTLGKTHLPDFPLPEGETADSYLKKLVWERITERFPEPAPEVKERVAYETDVIAKTGFAQYFLIVQDFVNWAKQRNIVVGPGRGSAAGSIVSYILGITDIDPIKYDLLFERFLNPDRIQMPDIDIDFTDARRDEVVAYVREKYGKDHVAQIITFGTMAARAALRDAGRAIGLSYGFCDQVAKLVPFNYDLKRSLKEVDELIQMFNTNPDAKRLISIAGRLEGVARHASVHACGIVITKEPLTEYLPLQYAPQDPDTVITQFEMHSVEDLGLLKMDFLGLRNLTIIEDTAKLVKEASGRETDFNEIPLNDPKIFELFRQGETTGLFQFESAGMRRYLKDLKPTELEDLIAMVSLYRPGPMDLIPNYIKRKQGEEKVTYLHPKLEPILKSTYGVGIYQEQMMKIARDLAGFTLAEADTLRKAIGKKIKELLQEQQEKLVNGMTRNGIAPQTARAIWELFPPFARYGLNRSHAACYALIAYQTAYLKAYYPVEFMTSILNASAGDTERIAFLVGEARRLGLDVFPPDINQSLTNFSPESQGIRFGLLAVKNVGEKIVEVIIADRLKSGPFENLENFLGRIQHRDLNKKSLESLIKCGTFDSLRVERQQAMDNIEEIIKFNAAIKKNAVSNQHSLFGSARSFSALNLKPSASADTRTKSGWEKELLGLYVSDHPLKSYAAKFSEKNVRPISEAVKKTANGARSRISIGGLVASVKRIITRVGKPMLFVKLEDMTDNVEVVVFSETLAKSQAVWRENNVILVNGRLDWRNGEPKVICESAVEL